MVVGFAVQTKELVVKMVGGTHTVVKGVETKASDLLSPGMEVVKRQARGVITVNIPDGAEIVRRYGNF